MLVPLLLVATAVVVAGLSKIELKSADNGARIFVEKDSGRQVIFHGVNAVVKGIPYVPLTDSWDIDISLSDKDHDALASLGVNVYRLGTMWPGAEPERGQYNLTYFQEINKIVGAAGNRGIYSLLDMHQDDLSEKFCGEGIPGWAAIVNVDDPANNGFPAPLEAPFTAVAPDGFPTRQDCAKYNWPSYYSTKACGSAFDSLYLNASGLLDSWGDFWAKTAQILGHHSEVLGYELINEPWAGDVFKEPKLYVPSVADKLRLQPAYDVLAPRIWAVQPEALVFFAGVTWDDPIPAGFEHAPGGADNADRSVFAFHFYQPPNGPLPTYFSRRVKDAERLQTGYFLTETMSPTEPHTDSDDPFVAMAETADAFKTSYATWEYKSFCKETEESLNGQSQQAAYGSCKTGYGGRDLWHEDGTLNDAVAKRFARSYARKVAGVLDHVHFDQSTGVFSVEFTANTAIKAPTEVFLHSGYHYPLGYDVQVFPPGALKAEVQADQNQLLLHTLGHVENGAKVRVVVTPKQQL